MAMATLRFGSPHRGCSLLLEEGAEKSPVEGEHSLGMGPLLGLLEVVLLGAEGSQHLHRVHLTRELLHRLLPARRRLCYDQEGQDGDPVHTRMDKGVSHPNTGWLLGHTGLVRRTLCWVVQTPCPGSLPQALSFPPDSEAMGDGVMLEGQKEQSLGQD